MSGMDSLFDTWLTREDSYYEERFREPIVEELCQYHGGSAEGRKAKGKFFNAGYEVFIYAFFLGLYYGERKPLTGNVLKFRMAMSSWGRKKNEDGRKSYTVLQKYIFAALVAKTNIDFIRLDKDDLDVNDVCKDLMTTLNEYANTGFYLMQGEMQKNPEAFFESTGLLKLMEKLCPQHY